MLRIVVAALFLSACAEPSSDEVGPPSPRAVYVRDAGALIASPIDRMRLGATIESGEVHEVVPYGLGAMLANEKTRGELASWIVELHGAGAHVVAPVSDLSRVDALESFGGEHPEAVLDGLVTEVEFWNRSDRTQAFDEMMALVTRMRALRERWSTPTRPVEIGAYLGYPTQAEARLLSASIDFVFLNYSVARPRDAWGHAVGMLPLRERFGWFAAAGTEIWPIFYAVGEVDMRDALASEGASGVEHVFESDLASDAQLHDASVAGFAYFAFDSLPDHW